VSQWNKSRQYYEKGGGKGETKIQNVKNAKGVAAPSQKKKESNYTRTLGPTPVEGGQTLQTRRSRDGAHKGENLINERIRKEGVAWFDAEMIANKVAKGRGVRRLMMWE